MKPTYELYYNRIKRSGAKILEARKDFFIVWENKEGTVTRAYYFDVDGIFEGYQIIKTSAMKKVG